MYIDWNARKAAMKKLAFQMDMQYIEKEEWGLINRLRDFKLFRRGTSKEIFNLIQKKDPFLEEQFFVFDYKYVIRTNNSAKRFNQTVFFIQSKKLGLPQFLMKPENFFHKIGSFLGMQDIDFVEYPEFSGDYLLKGDDEELIRDMMHHDMLRHFTVEKDWTMEGVGYFLLTYQHNKVFPVKTIREFMFKGMQVYGMLKEEEN